jgi:hypothetical protein
MMAFSRIAPTEPERSALVLTDAARVSARQPLMAFSASFFTHILDIKDLSLSALQPAPEPPDLLERTLNPKP